MSHHEGDALANRRPVRRHRRMGRIAAVALSIVFAMAAALVCGAEASAAGSPAASATASEFRKAMERGYQNFFEAALVTGAHAPNGASMSLNRLLALSSRDGLQRLDDGSISDLVRLRSELARESDTATCAGIWSGSIAQNLVPAIEKLPVDQQRQWAMIFNRAAQATINKVPIRPAPTPAEYQPALNRMLTGVAPADLRAIKSALDDSAHPTPDQECRAVRAFYGGMTRANPADAVMVARALLYK
jgi:hypothetical protein